MANRRGASFTATTGTAAICRCAVAAERDRHPKSYGPREAEAEVVVAIPRGPVVAASRTAVVGAVDQEPPRITRPEPDSGPLGFSLALLERHSPFSSATRTLLERTRELLRSNPPRTSRRTTPRHCRACRRVPRDWDVSKRPDAAFHPSCRNTRHARPGRAPRRRSSNASRCRHGTRTPIGPRSAAGTASRSIRRAIRSRPGHRPRRSRPPEDRAHRGQRHGPGSTCRCRCPDDTSCLSPATRASGCPRLSQKRL